MYERLGVRLVAACVLMVSVIGAVSMIVTVVWTMRYLRFSADDVVLQLAIAIPLNVVMVLVGTWLLRDVFAPVQSWWISDRSPRLAPEAWRAAVRLPEVIAVRALWLGLAVGGPIIVPFLIVTGRPFRTGLEMYLAGVVGLLAAIVLGVFAVQLVLRPMLEDVASRLPADFRPQIRGWSLRAKSLAPLPFVTLFSALTVGAFVDLVARGPSRLLLAFGIAAATISVAGAIFWVVNRSLLDPIDELLTATKRVEAGDIETPVQVATADELGELATGFNQMLASLRRHEQELRESRARIVAASDAARRRVERDLHDGAQQRLVLLGLKLGMAQRLVKDNEAAAALHAELRAEVAAALSELRDLAHGLFPAVLESDGLVGALRDAIGRAAIPTRLECDGAPRYPADVEAAAYFCCLEALQNAAKHAGPGAQATVTLSGDFNELVFEVSDDGQGFTGSAASGTAGLTNMTDRLGALGGSITIDSSPGAGTRVTGRIRVGTHSDHVARLPESPRQEPVVRGDHQG